MYVIIRKKFARMNHFNSVYLLSGMSHKGLIKRTRRPIQAITNMLEKINRGFLIRPDNCTKFLLVYAEQFFVKNKMAAAFPDIS